VQGGGLSLRCTTSNAVYSYFVRGGELGLRSVASRQLDNLTTVSVNLTTNSNRQHAWFSCNKNTYHLQVSLALAGSFTTFPELARVASEYFHARVNVNGLEEDGRRKG
jgi:hypothetical protein